MHLPQPVKIKSKSFLRWAGSKKKLLPVLSKHVKSDYNKYIEPFVGSAQLFFSLNPNKAVLSDTNRSLIDCYLAVKKNPLLVYNYLQELPYGKDEYYKIRNSEIQDWQFEKKAARFIYLNTYCFNGLYRTNKQGKFNVPFSNDASKMHTYEQLLDVSNSLKRAEFIVGDFETVVNNQVVKNDFVYLDPPYAVRNKDIFLAYGPETFGLSDIERLKKCIDNIDKVEATFLLSYAHCDESLEIASKWNSKIISTVRNISGFAQHRKQEKEILISNMPFND